MRKGSRSADARLLTFEKGMLYCKLTVASGIRKGLLHVSLGVVGNRCRCVLIKGFSLYRLPLHGLKTPTFFASKSFSFAEDLPKHPSKATLFRIPKAFHLHTPFFAVLKRHPILQTKSFSFAQAFLRCPQKFPVSINQKFSIYTGLSLLHPRNPFPPSISHSHPAITYCPPKNNAVLFISALNPYAVTPEYRTDSKPFRRRFVRKTGFGSCCRKTLLKSSSTEL